MGNCLFIIGANKIASIIPQGFHNGCFWIPILIAPYHFINIVIGAFGITYTSLGILVKGVMNYFLVIGPRIYTLPPQGNGIGQIPMWNGILAAKTMGYIRVPSYRNSWIKAFPNFFNRRFYPRSKYNATKPRVLFVYMFIKSFEPGICGPKNLRGNPYFGVRMVFMQHFGFLFQPAEQFIRLQIPWISTWDK